MNLDGIASLLPMRLTIECQMEVSWRTNRHFLLHFATHAISLPILPELSALVLFPGIKNHTPFLHLSQIESLNINNELTFLSACETALGKLYSGDGAISLTNAFLVAGSRMVIASLWPVHDQYTKSFVAEFYKQLKAHPAVEALALAKQHCIKGLLGKELEKAVYWGAFVLWGAMPYER